MKDLEDQYDIVLKRFKKILVDKGVFLVFGEVVAEGIYIMERLYKMTRTEIVSKFKPFLQTDVVALEDKNAVLAALMMYESTKLSYVDCLIIQKGRGNEIEIFTFDKKLLEAIKQKAVK